MNEGLFCLKCRCWFRNLHCFQRHLTGTCMTGTCMTGTCMTGTCSTSQTRSRWAIVDLKPNNSMDNHIRGLGQGCKICKEPMAPNHQCYTSVITPSTEDDVDKERQQVQFVFYDRGRHVPNFCVVSGVRKMHC